MLAVINYSYWKITGQVTEKGMEKDLEERVMQLELILSYQDQTIEDLNQSVIDQQKQLDKMAEQLDKFEQNIIQGQEEPNNKPPPHY